MKSKLKPGKCNVCDKQKNDTERRLIYDEYATLPHATKVTRVCKECVDFIGVYENQVRYEGAYLFF